MYFVPCLRAVPETVPPKDIGDDGFGKVSSILKFSIRCVSVCECVLVECFQKHIKI